VTALNVGWNEVTATPNLPANATPAQKAWRKVRAHEGPYNDFGVGIGNPESAPVFLDQNGFRPFVSYQDKNGITRYTPKLILDPQDIVILQFDVLTLFDFNRLPIR
jgi:hypothetical protein